MDTEAKLSFAPLATIIGLKQHDAPKQANRTSIKVIIDAGGGEAKK